VHERAHGSGQQMVVFEESR